MLTDHVGIYLCEGIVSKQEDVSCVGFLGIYANNFAGLSSDYDQMGCNSFFVCSLKFTSAESGHLLVAEIGEIGGNCGRMSDSGDSVTAHSLFTKEP